MSSFDLVLKTSANLHQGGDPASFVTEHTGVVRYTRDRNGGALAVGLVRAYRLHAGLADEAGVSLLDVCDRHSEQMHDLYAALFDPETDDLREDIRAGLDIFDPDVLVLDYVLLSPRWRGLRLGLAAARRMIELLSGGCGLAVSHVAPLDADAAEFSGVPSDWIPRHAGRDEEKEARRGLRRHFRRLGFRKVVGTRFHTVPLSPRTPTLENVVGKEGRGK